MRHSVKSKDAPVHKLLKRIEAGKKIPPPMYIWKQALVAIVKYMLKEIYIAFSVL